MATLPGLEIRAQWDSRQAKAALAALAPKQWSFATALTVTRVASHVKREELGAMRRVFDRPTPFTLNSLRQVNATRARPEARVWFKDRDFGGQKGTPATDYLMPQVHGGPRSNKRFEHALRRAGYLRVGRQLVPASGADLDAFGNVKRGIYTKVLTQLQASPDPTQNAGQDGRRRRRRRGPEFFYGNPGGKGRGIWRRFPRDAFGNRFSAAVEPIFLEARRRPSYRRRFDFFEIGERVATTHYATEFDRAALETLRTARP